MSDFPSFLSATADYEKWLAGRVGIVSVDLAEKHAFMKSAEFPFLRATFYRWAQLWPLLHDHGFDSPDTPEVLAVGDLHVENFGSWRDAEGRLAWGINDFDEACPMPYTIDLVRLAASTILAADAGDMRIGYQEACDAIRNGYRESLEAGGGPFVLGERHNWLLELVRPARPANFWEKIQALPSVEGKIPRVAAKGIERLLPASRLPYRLVHRAAGLGSRGRRRYAAIAEYAGGHVCREAKELAPSAWWWARQDSHDPDNHYQLVLDTAVRDPDPFVRAKNGWVVRRLAPDCMKIVLADVPKEKEKSKLLHAMGWETANIHLGSKRPRAILRDLDRRPRHWLFESARFMLEKTRADWMEWKG